MLNYVVHYCTRVRVYLALNRQPLRRLLLRARQDNREKSNVHRAFAVSMEIKTRRPRAETVADSTVANLRSRAVIWEIRARSNLLLQSHKLHLPHPRRELRRRQ